VRVFARIGLESFGGPAGQIAVMHRVLVEERRWLSERRFLHALDFCKLLPGPEAMQLATYAGWMLHGARGGLAAGLLFVLPGFLCVGALAWIYARWHALGPVAAIFAGLQPAVLAIVVQALLRIGRRALREPLA
jgi:chromate transporter